MTNLTLNDKLDRLYDDSRNKRLEANTDRGRSEWRDFLISARHDNKILEQGEKYFCEVSDAKLNYGVALFLGFIAGTLAFADWQLSDKVAQWYEKRIRHRYAVRVLGIN